MRARVLILAVLLAAGGLSAQESAPQSAETPAPKTDYSRETLMRLFIEADKDAPPIRYRRGMVEFHALGTDWHLSYLPFLMPLSGSGFGMNATYQTFPDPFALTNTQIATSQRAWRTRRNLKAEMRRIEKSERARLKVKTQ
jgi:hypothetical protein